MDAGWIGYSWTGVSSMKSIKLVSCIFGFGGSINLINIITLFNNSYLRLLCFFRRIKRISKLLKLLCSWCLLYRLLLWLWLFKFKLVEIPEIAKNIICGLRRDRSSEIPKICKLWCFLRWRLYRLLYWRWEFLGRRAIWIWFRGKSNIHFSIWVWNWCEIPLFFMGFRGHLLETIYQTKIITSCFFVFLE